MSEIDLSRFRRVTARDMKVRNRGMMRLRVGKNSCTLSRPAEMQLRQFPAYSWMIDAETKQVLIRFEDAHQDGVTFTLGRSNTVKVPDELRTMFGVYRDMPESVLITLHRTKYGLLFGEDDIEKL